MHSDYYAKENMNALSNILNRMFVSKADFSLSKQVT